MEEHITTIYLSAPLFKTNRMQGISVLGIIIVSVTMQAYIAVGGLILPRAA